MCIHFLDCGELHLIEYLSNGFRAYANNMHKWTSNVWALINVCRFSAGALFPNRISYNSTANFIPFR